MQPLETDLPGLLKLMVDGGRAVADRSLNPTQESFILSPDYASAYMGAAGVAKTSSGVAKIMARALLQPGSKHLIFRYDYNDLLDTTMKRAEEMIARLPPGTLLDRDKSPPAKWWIKAVPRQGPDGTIIEEPSQITFMGGKDGFGSYEFNSAFGDEADEFEEKRVLEVQTRLRAPVKWRAETPGGVYSIALAFNPPDTSHWLYTACTGLDHTGKHVKDPWLRLYVPNPKENLRNLPDGYYDKMAESLPEDMRQRLIEGQWGSVFPGEPVYRFFRRKLHVVDSIKYERGATLYRWWDFGFNYPACLWAMVGHLGDVFVMKELLGRHEEIRAFARRVKALTAQWFPEAGQFAPIRDYGDPAVSHKKDTGQALGMLHQEGITMHYKHVPFELSVNQVKKMLEMLIGGKPAVQVSKDCQIFIGGLSGGYHLKDDGVTPAKDGYYDHFADAFRYGVWNVLGPDSGSAGNANLPQSVAYDPNQDV